MFKKIIEWIKQPLCEPYRIILEDGSINPRCSPADRLVARFTKDLMDNRHA